MYQPLGSWRRTPLLMMLTFVTRNNITTHLPEYEALTSKLPDLKSDFFSWKWSRTGTGIDSQLRPAAVCNLVNSPVIATGTTEYNGTRQFLSFTCSCNYYLFRRYFNNSVPSPITFGTMLHHVLDGLQGRIECIAQG